MTTKICIVIRSFDHPFLENGGLPPYTRKIGLPESRVLYTVLRSPHIDKKSREQFEMEIKKKYLVIKTEKHELRKKFFWLKRQRLFGAQYEILFYCKTRLDKGKLQRLLWSKILALTLSWTRTGGGRGKKRGSKFPINKVRAFRTFPTPSFYSPFPSHSPFFKKEAPLPKKGPLSDKEGNERISILWQIWSDGCSPLTTRI